MLESIFDTYSFLLTIRKGKAPEKIFLSRDAYKELMTNVYVDTKELSNPRILGMNIVMTGDLRSGFYIE